MGTPRSPRIKIKRARCRPRSQKSRKREEWLQGGRWEVTESTTRNFANQRPSRDIIAITAAPKSQRTKRIFASLISRPSKFAKPTTWARCQLMPVWERHRWPKLHRRWALVNLGFATRAWTSTGAWPTTRAWNTQRCGSRESTHAPFAWASVIARAASDKSTSKATRWASFWKVSNALMSQKTRRKWALHFLRLRAQAFKISNLKEIRKCLLIWRHLPLSREARDLL